MFLFVLFEFGIRRMSVMEFIIFYVNLKFFKIISLLVKCVKIE